MANRRELVVAIVSDASQFSRGFDKAKKDVDSFSKGVDRASQQGLGKMDSRVGAVTASLKGLALAGGALVAGSKLIEFGRDSIQSFSDLNESVNAVEVTFGNAADGVLALGKNAAETVGLANSEFNSLAVGFSAFVTQIDGGRGDVVGILEDLTGRIADFASVMNLDVPEAAEKFRSGLAGQTEPLRKFGIDVSAAATTAKALELGLADSSSALTEQDKILARYHLIMEQTNKTAGDFANTSGDLANKQRILAAKLEDAKAKLGEGLVPALEAALPAMEFFIDLVSTAGIEFGKITGAFSDAEAATKEFEAATGASVDSAAALLTVMKELAEEVDRHGSSTARDRVEQDDLAASFSELADKAKLSGKELALLRGASDELLESLNLTREDVEKLASTIEKRLAAAGRTAVFVAKDDLEGKLVPGLKTVADRLAEASSAANNFGLELLALADPAFATIRATDKLAEAQENYSQQLVEFGPNSREARDATLELGESQAAANAAAERFALEGGPDAVRALRDLLTQAGASREVVQLLIDDLEGLNRTFNPKIIVSSSGETISTRGIIEGFASGGMKTGRDPILVGEKGPEIINPPSGSRIIPNHQLGGNTTYAPQVIVQGDVTGPALDAIERELILSGVGRWSEVG